MKVLSKSKKWYFRFLESSHLDEPSALARSGGLQIVRPTKTAKPAEKEFETKDTTLKTKIKETLPKQDQVVQKPLKEVRTTPTKAKEATPSVSKVPTDFTLEDGLQSIVDRYNTEKVKEAFKDWHNTLMMTFPDISKSYLFVISSDEKIELSEGVDNNAAVQVTLDSTVFIQMMTKQINPIKAYSSGSLEVKGEMKNMLKLRKLMF
jgi:putative sterol carrier protein